MARAALTIIKIAIVASPLVGIVFAISGFARLTV